MPAAVGSIILLAALLRISSCSEAVDAAVPWVTPVVATAATELSWQLLLLPICTLASWLREKSTSTDTDRPTSCCCCCSECGFAVWCSGSEYVYPSKELVSTTCWLAKSNTAEAVTVAGGYAALIGGSGVRCCPIREDKPLQSTPDVHDVSKNSENDSRNETLPPLAETESTWILSAESVVGCVVVEASVAEADKVQQLLSSSVVILLPHWYISCCWDW